MRFNLIQYKIIVLLAFCITSVEAQDLSGSFTSKFKRYQKGEQFSGPASLSWREVAWKGDRVHTQIILWSHSDNHTISYSINNMRNNANTIDASNIQLRPLEYIKGDPAARGCASYPTHSTFVEMAEALATTPVPTLNASDPVKLWMTIDVPSNTAPGDYSSILTITSGATTLNFTIDLQVVDYTLKPVSQWNFHLDLWQFPQRILDYYNKENPDKKITAWSPEHFALFKPEYELLADLGQKAIAAHIKEGALGDASMIRWIRGTDNTWTYNFTAFDSFVDSMTAWGITGQINCFSPVGWNKDEIPYWDESSNTMQTLSAPLGSTIYNVRWNHFLSAFKTHLTDHNWFAKTVLFMDEVPENDMNKVIAMIQANHSQWKIGLAYAHNLSASIQNALYDQSGILESTPTPDRQNRIVTFYTSCTQTVPNNYITPQNSPAEMTWMAWHALQGNYDGYLRWAYDNWTLADPSDSRDGSNTAGDFAMIYRKNNSGEFRGSLRTELLREGIQDYEKVNLLRNQLTNSAALKSLENIIRRFTASSGRNASQLVQQAQQIVKDIVRGDTLLVTGIETKFRNESIKIFPNPTTEEVCILLSSATKVETIEISTVEGKKMIVRNFDPTAPQSTYSIGTAGLSKGIYLIAVKYKTDQQTVRFFKE